MAKSKFTAVAVRVVGGCSAVMVMRDRAGAYWEGRSTLGVESMRPVRALEPHDAAAMVVRLLRSGGHTDAVELREAFGDGRPGALARVSAQFG